MRNRVLGVLFLQDCVQPRDWSIDDVSMIGSLADNLSVAIENAELHQERERQAVTDGLTGVANRRSFNENFTREFERARRYGETLSLVMIDLDFLKKINDTYGHQAGDEAIKMIGKMLRQSSRSIDTAARYGGEEFCLLLPNTEIDMAEQLADRLRRLINEEQIEGPGRISASLGVASYPLHADNEEALFQRADEALYAAKQGGRNQVKVATAAAEGFDIKNGRAIQPPPPAASVDPSIDNPQNPNKESMLDIK
jgi:diguanylate cyclase (GGDEF)-like protein